MSIVRNCPLPHKRAVDLVRGDTWDSFQPVSSTFDRLEAYPTIKSTDRKARTSSFPSLQIEAGFTAATDCV